jgi:hypothetical protein
MPQHFKEDPDAVRNVPESEWKKTDEAIDRVPVS